LAGFPAAAAAFHRTEPARLDYMRTLPPPDLVPLADLDGRYEGLVRPALNEAALEAEETEVVVPLEAEVRCAAASALRIFMESIWPEIMALARRDHARIAHAMATDPGLRRA